MKVVDVGSGNSPIRQANVLVDKYIDDDCHRRGAFRQTGAEVIEADVTSLPFNDNHFDFVNCTHVIEHVDKPKRAIEELQRVAKSGYIEVPSYIAERMLFGSSNHKWVYLIFGNQIHYKRSKATDSNNLLKFKLARMLDPFCNTCHTKYFWGHGRYIKYKFNNETRGPLGRIENFLSMTMGVVTQNIINRFIRWMI